MWRCRFLRCAFIAGGLHDQFVLCRTPARWRWFLPGWVVGTMLWVLTSLGFSWYVGHFASYGATYGSLGAFIAIMMWFFVSTYVVLFGAELNAGLEERAKGEQTRITGLPQPDPIVAAAVSRAEGKP